MRILSTLTAALGLAGPASRVAPLRPTSAHPNAASMQSGSSDGALPRTSQSSSVPGSGYPFSSASSLAYRHNNPTGRGPRLRKEDPTGPHENVVIEQHDPSMDFVRFNAANQILQGVQSFNWAPLVQEQNQGADANLQINRN